MRYTTRKKLRKALIISFVLLAFVIANYFLISKVFRNSTPINKSATLIGQGEYCSIFPYDDGVISITGTQLECFDASGDSLFSATLPLDGMKAYRNDNLTVCWYGNLVVLINSYGEILLSEQLPGENIILATCNASQFAVSIIVEGQTWIRVYDTACTLIEENIQPYLSALSIGYFGDKDVQLWSLMLDYHGTLPITKLNTSHPGNSQTGRITVNDQVCYDILPVKDYVYLVGTHHIQLRTYTNVKISEWLINGWSLQDSLVYDNNEIAFLLAPSDATGLDVPLSALWYINLTNDDQYRISMPANIIKAVLTQKKIYAISNEGIYTMDVNGKKRSFSKFSFTIDEFIGASSDESIAVRSGNNYYNIALN